MFIAYSRPNWYNKRKFYYYCVITEVMGKLNEHKNQDGLREPTGRPPNVTKKSIIEIKSGDQNPLKKTGRIPKSHMSRI